MTCGHGREAVGHHRDQRLLELDQATGCRPDPRRRAVATALAPQGSAARPLWLQRLPANGYLEPSPAFARLLCAFAVELQHLTGTPARMRPCGSTKCSSVKAMVGRFRCTQSPSTNGPRQGIMQIRWSIVTIYMLILK